MILSVSIVAGILALTLAITWVAARRNTSASSHYVAEGQVGPVGNGLAIAGDYVSAASFLGISGAIALTGFNGFYLASAVPLAYLLVLLVIAEPLRNLGRFTLADAVAARFRGRGLRGWLAVTTIVISAMYMVIQFVGAGLLVQALLGVEFSAAVLVLGVLMVVYTTFGGMLATTWVQVLKTGLLLGGTATVLLLVLAEYGPDPLGVVRGLPASAVVAEPLGLIGTADTISQQLALALGVMGLPHVMVRFLTVRDAPAARRSGLVALWVFSAFYLVLPFLGYGALRAVGAPGIEAAHEKGNLAAVQLAEALGGEVLRAAVVGVALATILAVLAGVAIATSGAFAHDLYTHVVKRGAVSSRGQLRAARLSLVGIALVAMLLALAAKHFNLAFLANVAFAVAASTNMPVLVLSIYWRGFNRTGASWALAGGLVVSLGLVALSPNVLGPTGLVTGVAPLFPLTIPALVSVPAAFLLAVAGSWWGRDRGDEHATAFDEIERAALVGSER
ncbi:cation acetate symporter [Saccharopolyspora erythraea]|uniref:solute symporter family protein n=1 Tax=Saccharopolyspora erythraea TaxID=1836 RepID=UPI001BAC7350|nr:cation acetate symporter [Saccharopolyspora erythraea]QUH03422.1 cation acetate symporter [Saccharopolyspora erythraea]